MKNGPIFEWSPEKIILDDHKDEEDFYKLINDIQHRHNDSDNSNYVPDYSDGDDNSLGSWEVEYLAMYKE